MDAKTIGDDDLYLGIDALDDEHRHLLGVMNLLLAACGDGSDAQVIDALMNEFISTVRGHICSEEAQMTAVGYAGLARHQAAHRALLNNLAAILRPIGSRAPSELADQLLGFLLAWLGDHILGEDRPFADFLKARGLA